MIWNFTTKVPKLLRLRAWLFALPLSILVNSSILAQNPCQPITRSVTNAKSTNSNVFDDIGVVMTNFLNDQSQAGWLFENGATFTENGDGTATLKGSIKQFGDYAAPRRFKVNVILRGQTFRTPEGSPYNKTDVSTNSWYYYPTFEGELTGLDALEGGKVTISRYAKAAQIGIGANQIPDETLDQKANGSAFWFTWNIISQPKSITTRNDDDDDTPTNANTLIFNTFDENKNIADMAFLVSGTPSVPCGECLAKAGKVKTGQLNYTLDQNGVLDVHFEQAAPNIVPDGYKVLYLLTKLENQFLQAYSEKPSFHICDTGTFCIHVLVYDPKTVDTSKFVIYNTRGIDLATWFKERGGAICGSYDFDGTCVNVTRCVAKAGTVKLENTTVLLEKDNGALISGKPTTDSKVPNGYKVLYVLTKGSNLSITQVSETPQFRVSDTGDYRVHTLVYDPATLSLNSIVLNQTKASEVLPLLFENGGAICASLNAQGTKVIVKPAPNPCINDIVPPVFIFCPPNKKIELDGAMCIPVSWDEPKATDNCCTPTLVYMSTPEGLKNGDPFHPGVSTITYTAKDCAGNITLCQFEIVIIIKNPCDTDKVVPVFTNCPKNVTVEIGADDDDGDDDDDDSEDCKIVRWETPSVIDNCTKPSLSSSYNSGYCFPIGTTTVLYEAVDALGNKAYCKFDVTVKENPCAKDKIKPVFSKCPTDIQVETEAECARVSWTAPTATDNCSTPSVSSNYKPQDCFKIGATEVIYIATDAKGNKDTCRFTVIVTKKPTNNDVNPKDCPDILSVRKVTSTRLDCGKGTPYAMWLCNEYYTAGDDLTFTEFANKTATLVGSVWKDGRSYRVNVVFSGRTEIAPTESPKIEHCVTAEYTKNWYYYTTTNGTVETPRGTVRISRRGPAFQIGDFGGLHENKFGASGWFNTSGDCVGDFNINLGENLAVRGVRKASNTRDYCGVGKGAPYAMFYRGEHYTANNDFHFTEYANGTARLAGSVARSGRNYRVDVTFSGRTAQAPTGSPKLELCAERDKADTKNWYYYTQMTGTLETPKDGTVKISRRGPAFQIGKYGNLQENTFGGSAWFWGNGTIEGDFNINLGNVIDCKEKETVNSLTPSVCHTVKHKVLREYWLNHRDWSFPTKLPQTEATGSDWLDQLCFIPDRLNWKDNYASRVRGYIIAPKTGNYVFNITGDDHTELYISTDEKPERKDRIAFIKGWTNPTEDCKYESQHSREIHLKKGKKYYFELITKEGHGGDHFTVRWKMPHRRDFSVIGGCYMTSFCVPKKEAEVSQAVVRADLLELEAFAEGSRTQLEWISTTGDLNDYFVVQKLDDLGNFTDLARVNAKFDDEIGHFSALDSKPTEGENIYRIKSVQKDGKEVFSTEKTIAFGNLKSIRTFPNPAEEYVEVDLKPYEKLPVTIYILNEFGQTRGVHHIEQASAAPHHLDLTNLESGRYVLRIVTKGKRDVVARITVAK